MNRAKPRHKNTSEKGLNEREREITHGVLKIGLLFFLQEIVRRPRDDGTGQDQCHRHGDPKEKHPKRILLGHLSDLLDLIIVRIVLLSLVVLGGRLPAVE